MKSLLAIVTGKVMLGPVLWSVGKGPEQNQEAAGKPVLAIGAIHPRLSPDGKTIAFSSPGSMTLPSSCAAETASPPTSCAATWKASSMPPVRCSPGIFQPHTNSKIGFPQGTSPKGRPSRSRSS